MKNLTITVEETALEWARIEAAKRNTSVSRMVGEMLVDKMRHDDAYARAMREWQNDATTFTSGNQPYPTRDQTYAERLDRFR
jgi:hypothetical protein